MRRWVLAAMMVGTAHSAMAADMPDLPVLRGFVNDAPRARTTWEGFYVGGQGAYGSSEMDFTNATRDLTAKLLNRTTIENEMQVSQWPVLGKVTIHGHAIGAFAGWNAQWDDAVIGLEANYLHGTFGGTSTGSMERFQNLSDGYTHDVTNTGRASININDMGTIRVRGGWAWNCLLPYGYAGLAIGLADINRVTTIHDHFVNPNALPGFQDLTFIASASAPQTNHIIYGYVFGAGMDVMLIGGLFARGEFEFTKFVGSVNTSVSSGRVGVGYKF